MSFCTQLWWKCIIPKTENILQWPGDSLNFQFTGPIFECFGVNIPALAMETSKQAEIKCATMENIMFTRESFGVVEIGAYSWFHSFLPDLSILRERQHDTLVLGWENILPLVGYYNVLSTSWHAESLINY